MIDIRELVWLARYKDGSFDTQYNVDGSYNVKYADIVRSELEMFELWSIEMTEKGYLPKKLVLRIYFDTPDKKLIYRRKGYKHSNGTDDFVYLAGWQMNVGGKSIQSISLVFEDGHVEVIGKWNKNHNIFDQPIKRPHENEDWEFDKEEATPEQIQTYEEYTKKK